MYHERVLTDRRYRLISVFPVVVVSWARQGERYPGLMVERGLVLAPVEKVYPLSEKDYAVPWDVGG